MNEIQIEVAELVNDDGITVVEVAIPGPQGPAGSGISTGAEAFTDLTDVPASYSGAATKVVSVKSDETGLEFVSAGASSNQTPWLSDIDADSFSVKFDDNTGIKSANGTARISVGNTSTDAVDSNNDTVKINLATGSSNIFPYMLVTSNNAGSNGPGIMMYHNSSSPAVNDVPAVIDFMANDATGTGHYNYYASIHAKILDTTFTLFDGALQFNAAVNGNNAQRLYVHDGVIIGSGTVFPGAGKLRVDSIELNHDTANSLTASGGVLSVEGNTVATLTVENQALTGGVTVAEKDLGTVSSGTTTLDMGDRPMHKYTNNGAHTLAPGTTIGSTLIAITNGASAGAIATSGWTKVAGDSFTTTNAHKFLCAASVSAVGSLLTVQAMQ